MSNFSQDRMKITDALTPAPEEQGNDADLFPTQSYLSLALEMIKSSGIYALGALVSPLVSLILTPFLTRQLPSTEYGGLAVLYTLVDLLTVITQLGLSPAFFRAYNGDYETEQDRAGVISATLILLTLLSVPVAVTLMVTAPWLSELLFKSPAFAEAVSLTALVMALENLTLPGLSWLRAEKRAVLYSILSIANLLLTLGASVILVGVLHLGVNGALIAKGTGYALIVVFTVPTLLALLIRQRSLSLRAEIVRNMLSFGIPTIFSDLAAWVLQLSDRYLLGIIASLAQTAVYSVSYLLGGALSPVVLSPWGLAWVPIRYAIAKREDATHVFRLVFRWFSMILLFATFALSLLSIALLELLFPSTYHAAEPIIPIISLSTMLIGINYIFMTGIYICRKTTLYFIFTTTAACVNVALNLLLIPTFGAMGAAISTLIAYIVMVIVTYTVNQRIYPIPFEIGRFLLHLFIGVILYAGSSVLVQNQASLIRWCIYIVALMTYGVLLLLLGGVSIKDAKKALQAVKEIVIKRG